MGLFRMMLATAVFFSHLNDKSDLSSRVLDGGVAVFCFFVVSGFYMEMVLSEKYNQQRLGKSYWKLSIYLDFFRLHPIDLFIAPV